VIAIEIPGWMSEIDLQWLGEQAKHHDLIVEIGSYQGRSTRALGDNARGVVYAVDDWKGLRSVDKEWWENGTPESERETLYERFCLHIVDLLKSGKVIPVRANHAEVPSLPGFADMVFIDGSHGYEDVKRDIQTWLPRLKSGGLLCGHDYGQEPLMRAVNESIGMVDSPADLIWSWIKP
jgi:predicted O-methyltransferase YrrM